MTFRSQAGNARSGINGSLAQSAPTAIPFGGTKRSGFGRELGRSGMDRFANIKSYGIL